jgi:hypothetical protein
MIKRLFDFIYENEEDCPEVLMIIIFMPLLFLGLLIEIPRFYWKAIKRMLKTNQND